jgi:hypothetical protein
MEGLIKWFLILLALMVVFVVATFTWGAVEIIVHAQHCH